MPARDLVAGQLLDLFRRGALKPGDRLPTENEIMQLTGVGRSTVREAVRTLASMQLLEVRPGSGTYVSQRVDHHLDDPQMLLLLDNRHAVGDLVEARRIVEPAIAELAAQRALPNELETMERALARMARGHAAGDPSNEWREAHLTFHTALAQSSHNVVLVRMWASVATFLRDSPLVGPAPPTNWRSVGLPLHEHLYQAVGARNPEQAVSAMEAHIADMIAFMDRALAVAATRDGGSGEEGTQRDGSNAAQEPVRRKRRPQAEHHGTEVTR